MSPEHTLNLVVHILHSEDRPLKSTEIASKAMLDTNHRRHCVEHGFDLHRFDSEYSLGQHIGTCIARHQKSTSDARRLIKGSKSLGWEVGPAGLHALRVSHKDLMRPADKQFSGLVGEFAVMSELLACNWNVAKLPHDDGVDLIATKDQKLRTVQVKTAHASAASNQTYTFTVTRRAHDDYDSVSHYYILVLRRIQGPRYVNDYLIFNSRDINELAASGDISIGGSGTSWSIVARAGSGSVLVGSEDCTPKMNRFATLFR